jgi:hypothetical protein
MHGGPTCAIVEGPMDTLVDPPAPEPDAPPAPADQSLIHISEPTRQAEISYAGFWVQ